MVICRLLGHNWIEAPIRYKQSKTVAYSDSEPEGFEADVTWTCDEVCSRCHGETWIPW